MTANIKNNLKNFSFESFDDYNSQLTAESKQEASILFKKNIRPNAFHFIIKPFIKFSSLYFFRLGFLKGKKGFIYAYILAFAVFKRYLQLWLMYRKIN